MPTSNPAARVQLIPSPIMSPGCCALCGKASHKEGFADPGLNYEFHGSFYLCGDCIGDFARLFGWEHPNKVNEVLAENEDLKMQLHYAYTDLQNLGEIKDAIDNYNGSARATIPDSRSDVPVPDNSPADEDGITQSGVSEQQPKHFSSDIGEVPATELDITESISLEGPVSVPTDSSNVDEFLSGLDL